MTEEQIEKALLVVGMLEFIKIGVSERIQNKDLTDWRLAIPLLIEVLSSRVMAVTEEP